ncbi:putative polysaccharide biosynthesis protein [Clostridium uliginosum]|uniref:Stage V sporulation protein B n=1 Tax=Clostridium uliginosum TaxID=119641 RepID=A0A1I1M8L9_9CLOT|nr:polysaccharide biosynthesis protein [Clostridium uliginosum]SFC78010.1 stage V sporulation protein B [Clostridium uliginosum]
MKEQSSTKGFVILSAAGILAKLMSVFYVPFLRRTIGLEGLGIYQMCYEVFLFVYAVTTLGAQPAVAKVVAELSALENKKDAIKALRISRAIYAVIGGVLSILLMIFAFKIGDLIGTPEASYGILFLSPSIFVTAILSAYRGYFQGRNNMTAIAVSQVLEQVINVATSLIFAYILVKISVPYGSAGGTIGTTLGAFIACLYMIYIYYKKNYEEEALNIEVPTKRMSNKRIVRKLVKYGVPITLSAGLQNLGSLVDMVNVKNRLSFAGFAQSTANELYGVLGTYKTLLSVPLVIVTALATTVLPAIVSAVALKNKKEVKKKVNFAFRITYAVTIPAAVGLAILSREIYKLLYASERGYELMIYGSVVVIFMAVVQIQNVILQSMNKLYYVLGTFMIGIITKITANYILVGIKDINVLGAVFGNFLWFVIPFILNQRKISKTLKMKLPIFKHTLKPIISSLGMVAVIYLVKEPLEVLLILFDVGGIITGITTIIMIGIAGFVYLYLMIVLGGIRKNDVNSFSPRLYNMLPRFLRKRLR